MSKLCRDKEQEGGLCCAFCRAEAVVVAQLPSVHFLKPTLATPLCLLHCYTNTATRCNKCNMISATKNRRELERQLPVVLEAISRAVKRVRDSSSVATPSKSSQVATVKSLENDLHAMVTKLVALKPKRGLSELKSYRVQSSPVLHEERQERVTRNEADQTKEDHVKRSPTMSSISSSNIKLITPETSYCKKMVSTSTKNAVMKKSCRLPFASIRPVASLTEGI